MTETLNVAIITKMLDIAIMRKEIMITIVIDTRMTKEMIIEVDLTIATPDMDTADPGTFIDARPHGKNTNQTQITG